LISVDDRIGSIELLPILQQMIPSLCSAVKYLSTSPAVTSTRLLCGDICFDGQGPKGISSIGIERKRLGDMLNSIRSGRYSGGQLPQMLNFYDHSYLFIEGYYRCGYDGSLEQLQTRAHDMAPALGGGWVPMRLGSQIIRYTELDHFICTLQSKTPVKIRTSINPHETCAQIISLYTHYLEPWDSHHSHESLHVPQSLVTVGKAGLVRKWAADLSGIGWQRSGAVAVKFRTGLELASAGPEEWATIPGIGKTLAHRAFDQIRGLFKDKGEL
jgi:ERCC4-type nuclease